MCCCPAFFALVSPYLFCSYIEIEIISISVNIRRKNFKTSEKKTNKKPIGTCCRRRYLQRRMKWIGKALIANQTASAWRSNVCELNANMRCLYVTIWRWDHDLWWNPTKVKWPWSALHCFSELFLNVLKKRDCNQSSCSAMWTLEEGILLFPRCAAGKQFCVLLLYMF